MTDHHHPKDATADQPTQKQLGCLRGLANATGQTFTYPKTKGQASAEIARLQRATRSSATERRIDRALADTAYAPRVLAHETTGYGAAARWA